MRKVEWKTVPIFCNNLHRKFILLSNSLLDWGLNLDNGDLVTTSANKRKFETSLKTDTLGRANDIEAYKLFTLIKIPFYSISQNFRHATFSIVQQTKSPPQHNHMAIYR